MYDIMHAIIAFFKRLLTSKVRASLYAAGVAAVPGLVASGQLPSWALPLAAPMLLALLKVSPDEVETGEPDWDDDLLWGDESIVTDEDEPLLSPPYLAPQQPKPDERF